MIRDKMIALPKVYKVCGGNVSLVKRMLFEYVLSGGRINPDDFLWLYKQELNQPKL